jgi:hypothetical protein
MAIEFTGFTADHRVTGRLPLADDRLSDMLNSVARVVIRGAVTEAIDTGESQAGDVMVACGGLLVVAGSGRRGIESQRKRTTTRRIRVGLSRYVVEGDLHVPTDSARLGTIASLEDLLAGRDVLVPLTSALLTYDRAGKPVDEAHETLLVNRSLVEWIEPAGMDPEAEAWAAELIGIEPTPSPQPARAGGRSRWASGLRGVVGR